MEIEIPDLDEVEFVETCRPCLWDGINPKCNVCDGRGTLLSPVGHRLVTFLKEYYGLDPKKA